MLKCQNQKNSKKRWPGVRKGGTSKRSPEGLVRLQFSFVSAKFPIFRNASQSDLRRQINGSRQDLTIGGLGTPDHVAIFKHRIKSVSGAGDQVWGKN